MDISNLIIQLQAKVNDLTYNQLAVAKSIELLKTGQVNYANSISELPSATASNGKMYYVRSLGIYYSNGTSWETIETINEILQGFIYGMGNNGLGQLGINSVTNCATPSLVVGNILNWCQVSAGMRNSLAVGTNGTAWAWGTNYCGSLGTNSTVSRSSPVSVVGGFTDWCQISAGGFFANNVRFSIGIRQNGTAWAWGYNAQGQIGDNTLVSKSSPVSVVGGFTDWCQVSTGSDFSLAVRQNGTAWGWGNNANGNLGDNTLTCRSSPVSVIGGFTDWCQVSAAWSQFKHSLGVRQNGTAWAWGNNGNGRLGDNSTVSKSSPVSVVGGFTDWCQVSGGNSFSVGIRQNGTAWSWGYGCHGRLGDNTITEKSSPVSVVGGFTDWCRVSAGVGNAAAVRTNGTLWGWGQNNYCQLGTGNTTSVSSPVSVIGGFCDWCQVSAGFGHVLGIRYKIDS